MCYCATPPRSLTNAVCLAIVRMSGAADEGHLNSNASNLYNILYSYTVEIHSHKAALILVMSVWGPVRLCSAKAKQTGLNSHLNNEALSMKWEESKFPIFGNTSESCDASSPTHSATGRIKFSHGCFGISRPLPASCSAPGKKDFGKELKMLPPWTAPPATM